MTQRDSGVKEFLERLVTDPDMKGRTAEVWAKDGPPVWLVKSQDYTTGETTPGHYLLSYLTEEQIRDSFLELYRQNPNYRNHNIVVRLSGPKKMPLEDVKKLGLLKGSPLEGKV